MSTGQAVLSSSMAGSPKAGFQTSTDLADEPMGSNGFRQFIIPMTAGNRSSMLSLVPLAPQVPWGSYTEGSGVCVTSEGHRA